MATLDEITKEKQRLGEALARADAQRERLTSQLNELEAAERARTLWHGHASSKDGLIQNADHSNEGGRSGTRTRAAGDYGRKGRWQARLIEPQRSGSCSGNRQDAARNHRSMQGRSPKPCRCRHCPAQAGWPH